MVGVFTAGYWVVSRTYGDPVWVRKAGIFHSLLFLPFMLHQAVIAGVFSAIVALMAEVWLIIIRGERLTEFEARKKRRQQARAHAPSLAAPTATVVEQYSSAAGLLPIPAQAPELAQAPTSKRGKQKTS